MKTEDKYKGLVRLAEQRLNDEVPEELSQRSRVDLIHSALAEAGIGSILHQYAEIPPVLFAELLLWRAGFNWTSTVSLCDKDVYRRMLRFVAQEWEHPEIDFDLAVYSYVGLYDLTYSDDDLDEGGWENEFFDGLEEELFPVWTKILSEYLPGRDYARFLEKHCKSPVSLPLPDKVKWDQDYSPVDVSMRMREFLKAHPEFFTVTDRTIGETKDHASGEWRQVSGPPKAEKAPPDQTLALCALMELLCGDAPTLSGCQCDLCKAKRQFTQKELHPEPTVEDSVYQPLHEAYQPPRKLPPKPTIEDSVYTPRPPEPIVEQAEREKSSQLTDRHCRIFKRVMDRKHERILSLEPVSSYDEPAISFKAAYSQAINLTKKAAKEGRVDEAYVVLAPLGIACASSDGRRIGRFEYEFNFVDEDPGV